MMTEIMEAVSDGLRPLTDMASAGNIAIFVTAALGVTVTLGLTWFGINYLTNKIWAAFKNRKRSTK